MAEDSAPPSPGEHAPQRDAPAPTSDDDRVDEASEDSFPASDPPTWVPSTGPAGPD